MKTIHPSAASPRWPSTIGRARKASRAVLCALLFVLAVVAIPMASPAQAPVTLSTLHNFSASDGENPEAALVLGSDGNFYGTSHGGGSNGNGTVFSITPAGVLTTLHDFSFPNPNNGTNSDGGTPSALVQGSGGTFYGTTKSGGSGAYGTVFSITPAGVLTTLHNFGATNGDGTLPAAALVQGPDGNLYGTTENGGSYGHGTVFSITTGGVLTTLHSFGGIVGGSTPYSDGTVPAAALVLGDDGNFYGTTHEGGTGFQGTVFSINLAGVLTTLHTFSDLANDGTNSDGAEPAAALVQGPDGNLYGTTENGGSYGHGTVFSITAGGVLTTLHSFAASNVNNDSINSDGEEASALVLGSDGNFYGTTHEGGGGAYGTVFSITPAGVLTTLHTFSDLANDGTNSDGAEPAAALVQGPDGNLYGTTENGGSGGDGTVFELVVHPAFFTGEVALSNGVYYLSFPSGYYFGYYSFLADPHYIYHQDLGYEYVFDADDGKSGVYLYDFKSSTFFYTSPSFPFPYLYDFSLNTVLYYYPDPNNAGHYNTDGIRYFYDFATGKIISK